MLSYSFHVDTSVLIRICEESSEPSGTRTGRKLQDAYISKFMPGIIQNENGNKFFSVIIYF